jgi:hypothetical protein
MSISIIGFTQNATSPFQTFSGTKYYAGLSGSGSTYYKDPTSNLYIFQQVNNNSTATGTVMIPANFIPANYYANIKYYLVGGGGGGGAGMNGDGGKFVSNQINISGTTTLTLSIGAGGLGSILTTNPTAGGNTTLTYLGNTTDAIGGLPGLAIQTRGSNFTDSLGNIYYYGSAGGTNFSGGYGCGFDGGGISGIGSGGGGGGGTTGQGGFGQSNGTGGAGGTGVAGTGGVGGTGSGPSGAGTVTNGANGGIGCGGGAGGTNVNNGACGNGGNGGVGGGGGSGGESLNLTGNGGKGGINGGGGGVCLATTTNGGDGGVGLVILEITLVPIPPTPTPTPTPIYNICFPAGTPVVTDQGNIPIERLDPEIHTIHTRPIVAITQTTLNENKIVCIEKHALGINIPSRKTYISNYHGILYNNKLIPAKQLVGRFRGIYHTKYNGEILYNILMEKHYIININNIRVETLNPKNIVAKLYTSNYNDEEKMKLILEINEISRKNVQNASIQNTPIQNANMQYAKMQNANIQNDNMQNANILEPNHNINFERNKHNTTVRKLSILRYNPNISRLHFHTKRNFIEYHNYTNRNNHNYTNRIHKTPFIRNNPFAKINMRTFRHNRRRR